jgi:2-dehydro-3-deoxyglucarate aldolase/4-hydroxy-2-oxoheptanedioate aldolase
MTGPLDPGQILRRKLRAGRTTFGLWVTLESPSITEIATHLGLDWVCIDAEHGHLDFKEVVEHLRAAARSSIAALVRVQEIEQGLIKRVLDLGAHGILVPQIRNAEEVEQAVRLAKYPPRGIRGIGGERSTLWGKALSRARTANENTLVIPLLETVDAARNLESIMDVPDVDAFFLGPADFSASAGFPGEWEGLGVAEELLRIKDCLAARQRPCGVMATDSANGQLRIQQGFRMIGLGSECGLLIRAVTEMMAALGHPIDSGAWAR